MANYRLTGSFYDEGQWVADSRLITTAAARAEVGEEPQGGECVPEGEVTNLVGYFMPPLVDVHAHLGIGTGGGQDPDLVTTHAATQLLAGVGLVRDCGTNFDPRPHLPTGAGPILIHCGQHLARPKRYLRDFAAEVETVTDLPAAVAAQAEAGDGWVKIVADWIDRDLGDEADLTPLWPTPVLIDAVAAAHENGARVCAHTFSHAAIDGLLAAGVDSIEHGTGMDREQMDEAARRNIAVTPTLLQVELFASFAAAGAAKYPRYSATMAGLYDNRHSHFEQLLEAGVQLLPGTDAGGYQAHGQIGAELCKWVEYGMDPAAVIDAATWRAWRFLGYEPTGWIGFRRDPRRSIEALTCPDYIFHQARPLA